MPIDRLSDLEQAAERALAELDALDRRKAAAFEARLSTVAEGLEVSVAASRFKRIDPRQGFASTRTSTRPRDD